MDPEFFRTKYFLVAAIVAGLLLGGAASAYFANDRFTWSGNDEDGCFPRFTGGDELAPASRREINESERRTITWTFNASALTAGEAALCVAIGELLVEPSPDDSVHVEARIHSRSQAAIDATEVVVEFAQQGDKLNLAAYEARVGHANGAFGDDEAELTLIVRLPARGAWDLDADTAVGDVRVSDLLVGNLTASASVGEIRTLEIDLIGDFDVKTSVGSIIVDLRSVQTGSIVANADVDNVEISLPTRADVGYDVTATANVGDVDVRIGETETYTSRDEEVGGDVHAVSKGYSSKPTQVTIDVGTNVGDIRVVTKAA